MLANTPCVRARNDCICADTKLKELETLTDITDQAFTTAREAVRGCQTFRNLCAGDQRRIEAVVFSPFSPWWECAGTT